MDIAAAVFVIVGVWMIGSRNSLGFIICMVGSIMWICYAFQIESNGLMLEGLAMLIVNFRGRVKWEANGKWLEE